MRRALLSERTMTAELDLNRRDQTGDDVWSECTTQHIISAALVRHGKERDPSVKAKLSNHRSIYVPTLTYGYELWVVTERIRSQTQVVEINFL